MAAAADLPGEGPVAPIPTMARGPTWDGWHLGAETLWDIGLQAQHNDDAAKFNLRGATGGLQFGYDWQLANWLVLGAYTSATIGKFEGMTDAVNCKANCIVEIQGLMTFGGRLGVPVWDRLLLYGRLGSAFGYVNAGFTSVGTKHNWVSGYEAAGGAELRLSTHASLYGELVYLCIGDTHFGKDTFELIPGPIARFGFNYRF